MMFSARFRGTRRRFQHHKHLDHVDDSKTREIGLFKALGFSNRSVTSIFIWMGLFQGLVGTVCGWGLAVCVLAYRNEILHFLSRQWRIELLPNSINCMSYPRRPY